MLFHGMKIRDKDYKRLGQDFLLHVEVGMKFIEKMPEVHTPGY